MAKELKARERSPDQARKGGRSKGKGRGGEGKSQGKWYSQEGKGKYQSTSQGSGKGYGSSSQSSWSNWQPQETPTPWAKSKPKETTWSSKGDRTRPAPNRRLDNSDPALTPCSNCMALLGTNSDCMECQNSDNLNALRSISLFQNLEPFVYPSTAYKTWLSRYYGPTHSGHNPTPNVLMLGYERAMLDAFDEDPDTFLKELKEYSKKLSKYSSYPSDLTDWFNAILYPQKDDPLYELPWDLEYTQFKLPSPSFLLYASPQFQCLGYPIEVCNVHESSKLLTIFF